MLEQKNCVECGFLRRKLLYCDSNIQFRLKTMYCLTFEHCEFDLEAAMRDKIRSKDYFFFPWQNTRLMLISDHEAISGCFLVLSVRSLQLYYFNFIPVAWWPILLRKRWAGVILQGGAAWRDPTDESCTYHVWQLWWPGDDAASGIHPGPPCVCTQSAV